MADAGGIKLVSFGNMASVAAMIGGAVYGYFQAGMSDAQFTALEGVTALEGAAIFGVAGLILGRLAGFVLKSVLQMIVFFGIIVLLLCIFREPIRDTIGFDPAAFLEPYFGMAIERVREEIGQ